MENIYVSMIALTVTSMLVSIFLINNNEGLSKKTRKGFIIVVLLIIIASLLQFFGEMLNGADDSYRALHLMVKCAELSIAPIIPFVYGCSVYNLRKKIIPVVFIVFHILLEVLSSFYGFVYYVDSNNIYYRSDFYGIYYIVYLIGFMFLVAQIYRYASKCQNQKSTELFAIMLFTLSGMVCQIIDDSIKIVWVTVAIGFLMFYIHYNTILANLDCLTGLLTRGALDKALTHLKGKVIILFFDANNFKIINDTYGHAYGDECLTKIAELIRANFGKVGSCYRYGGDEFCVVMTKKTEDVEKHIFNFINGNKELIKKENHEFPLVSCGYSIFHPGDNIEEVITMADEKMYENKNKAK